MFNGPVSNLNGLMGIGSKPDLPKLPALSGQHVEAVAKGQGHESVQLSFVEKLKMAAEGDATANLKAARPAIIGGREGTLVKLPQTMPENRPQTLVGTSVTTLNISDFPESAQAKNVNDIYVADDFYADGLVLVDGEIMLFAPVYKNDADLEAFKNAGIAGMVSTLPVEDRIRQGNEVMTAALDKISSLLGLSLDTAPGEPFVFEFDPESIEHLATIIWYIDLTVRMIDDRLDTGNGVDIARETLERMGLSVPQLSNGYQEDIVSLSEFSALLRREKFNMEMAFRFLGVHEMMSALVAERTDKNVSIGIPQAAHPASLTMSTHDLAHAFSSLIKEELVSAMDRVRAITSGQAEMTELEKAAVRLGTVKSEILKAALDGNGRVNGAVLEKLSGEFYTALQKSAAVLKSSNTENVEADAGAKAAVKTAANDIELPISVKESVNKKAVERVEAANRRASESVALTVKSVAGDGLEVPVSVKESTNKSAADGTVRPADKKAPASIEPQTAKIIIGDDGADVPVSVKESVTKKTHVFVKAEPTNNRTANVAENVEAAVKEKVHAADAPELPVSVRESVKVNKNTAADRKASSGAEAPAVKIITGDDGVDVPVSAMEAVNRKSSAKKSAAENDSAAKALTGEKAAAVSKPETLARNDYAVKSGQDKAQVKDAPDKYERAATGPDKTESVPQGREKVRETGRETVLEKFESVSTGLEKSGNAPKDYDARTAAGAPSNSASPASMLLSGTVSNGTMTTPVGAVEAAGGPAEVSTDSGEPQLVNTVNSKAAEALDHADKARAALSRVDQEAVIRQINEKLQHAIRTGIHELRVTLRPEALGEVRMSIRVQGDIVLAQMQVENQQVKAAVESNLQSLKDTLEKQNMHVGAFSVDVGTGDSGRSPRQMWRDMAEMAEASGMRRFRNGVDGVSGNSDIDNEMNPLTGARGSDTGRRFGSNTFEYFI